MFLNVSSFSWVVMLFCAIGAFLYALLWERFTITESIKGKYFAILLCTGIAVIATVISKSQKYVGAPMIALIIGILIENIVPAAKMSSSFKRGTSYVGKQYLSIGIVLLGATLAFTDIFSAIYALPLVIFNIILSFSVAFCMGKKVLHLSSNVCTLVGGGTCVCGGTAIAALSPIIHAKEEETAYAMTSIFLFDLLACLSYPYLAVYFGFSPTQFGFLAGTAINDTSSVVAAQETFASLSGLTDYALPATIKVVRTSMIIVLSLFFSLRSAKSSLKSEDHTSVTISIGKTVWNALPKFILFFIVTISLNTVLVKLYGSTAFYTKLFKPFFANSYKFFITLALAGVGFKVKFKDLFTKGILPIVLGGCTWISLFISSLLFCLLFASNL